MSYTRLVGKKPQCEISTVDTKCKPFIGFPIRSQYDVERLSIPEQYKPIYIKDDLGQIYYGVRGGFSLGGYQLYDDLIQLKPKQTADIINILNSWNINICESYKYTTKKIVSLDFSQNKTLIERCYGNLDIASYNHSKSPSYIKVAGMYIFIFLP